MKIGKFKYIDSLSDNQIRTIIRAIMWPELSDEEILNSQESDYFQKVHNNGGFERLKQIEHLFPEYIVKEFKFMDLNTRFILVQQTTNIPIQMRVDNHVKHEKSISKCINDENEKLGITHRQPHH